MGTATQAKRDLTATLLGKHLKDKATYAVPDGGLAFWIVPEKQTDWRKVSEKLQGKGIKIITPDNYSFDKTVNGIRLGYGSLSEQDLEEGIVALAKML